MTTFTSTQDGNWNDDATWGLTSGDYPGNGHTDGSDRAIIAHTVTNNGNHHIGSVTINASKVLNGGGGNILYMYGDGEAIVFENNGSVTATPRLEFRGTASKNVKFGTGTFGIVDVNFGSAATLTMTSALTSSNNIPIAANCILDTSGSNYAITTTGDVTVTGTLTGNASAISMGSLTIASGGTYNATSGTTTLTDQHTGTYYLLDNNGTFTHNNGTVTITDAGRLSLNTGTTATHTLNNLIINLSSSGMGLYGALTIEGDFTITSGGFSPQGQGGVHGTHVLGNTSVASAGVLGDGSDGSMTFHGLVTNLGELKLLQGQTYKFNGGLRQLGTFTTP